MLAEIDPRDYQVAVDQARADVATAEATAHSLSIDVPVTSVNTTSQVSTAEADVQDAEAGIGAAQQQYGRRPGPARQAQANDVKAQNDLARYKLLVASRKFPSNCTIKPRQPPQRRMQQFPPQRLRPRPASQQMTQARARLAQAQATFRSSQTGPQQVASIRARAAFRRGTVKAKEAALEARRTESSIHESLGAGGWRGHQESSKWE